MDESAGGARNLGKMNLRRQINWRRRQTECQSALAQWMEESTDSARNADPKVGGPTLTTPWNMIQTSLLMRNHQRRTASHTDKSTLEKDLLHNTILVSQSKTATFACQETPRTTTTQIAQTVWEDFQHRQLMVQQTSTLLQSAEADQQPR